MVFNNENMLCSPSTLAMVSFGFHPSTHCVTHHPVKW